MNKAQLKMFAALLRRKREEILERGLSRDEIAIEHSSEELEQGALAAQRELAIRVLDHDARVLRDVEEALVRIADRSYGSCLNCEEDIPLRRLEAIAWAKLCVACQQAADRAARSGGSAQDVSLTKPLAWQFLPAA